MCARNWRYSLALASLILVFGTPERSIAEQAADSSLESKLAKLEARIEALEKENAELKKKPAPKPDASAALSAKSSKPEMLAYAKAATAPRRAAPAVLSSLPVPVWSGIYAGASFGLAGLKANESNSYSFVPNFFYVTSSGETVDTSSQVGIGNASSIRRDWGALADIYVGYNAVLNGLVFGLQGEGTLSHISTRLVGTTTTSASSTFSFGGPPISSETDLFVRSLTDQITSEWMVSALARAGVLIGPSNLLYVIGGYTYGRFSSPAQTLTGFYIAGMNTYPVGSFLFGMNGTTVGAGWESLLLVCPSDNYDYKLISVIILRTHLCELANCSARHNSLFQ